MFFFFLPELTPAPRVPGAFPLSFKERGGRPLADVGVSPKDTTHNILSLAKIHQMNRLIALFLVVFFFACTTAPKTDNIDVNSVQLKSGKVSGKTSDDKSVKIFMGHSVCCATCWRFALESPSTCCGMGRCSRLCYSTGISHSGSTQTIYVLE